MIAIPVKTNGENPALSPLFGKAKWFAFVDQNGVVTIEKNETQSGRVVVDTLAAKGVDTILFHHMGGNPFLLLKKANIKCFFGGDERITLQELLEKLQADALQEVTIENMNEYVEKGAHTHGHDHDHEHHHDHHHSH